MTNVQRRLTWVDTNMIYYPSAEHIQTRMTNPFSLYLSSCQVYNHLFSKNLEI
jgi:hypothetical protein